MADDEVQVALARHDSYLARVEEMLFHLNAGQDIPNHLLFHEDELKSLDRSLKVLATKLLKSPPDEDVWVAPSQYAFSIHYGKGGPSAWLEALYRGLKQSQAFFQAFGMQNSKGANVTNYNITIKDIVGPVNVLSRLENVVQDLNNSPSLATASKATLTAMFNELKGVVSSAPASHAADAELISEQAEAVAEELKRPEPRTSALQIKASGLIEAAKALEAVVPTAVAIAKKIAAFVAGPMA